MLTQRFLSPHVRSIVVNQGITTADWGVEIAAKLLGFQDRAASELGSPRHSAWATKTDLVLDRGR